MGLIKFGIIKFLDRFIDKYEDLEQIAEVQYYHAGHYPSWYNDMKEYHSKVEVLKEVKEELTKLLEKAKTNRKADIWRVWTSDRPQIGKVCCSNYRVMLVVDTKDHMVKAAFWTPELEKECGVQNSHRALMDYLIEKYRDENGICTLALGLRWGGFYTCGLGNGQQEQLTLYGESSDYRHRKNSDCVKNSFLNSRPFELGATRSFWEIVSGMTDDEFDEYVDSINK